MSQATKSQEADAAIYLANHYEGLGDQSADFRNGNLIKLVAAEVRGESVMDIGCGGGALLRLLHDNGHQTYGIEPNEALIELTEKKHPGLTIYQGFGDKLDDISETFDTITIIDVLEHIEDDRAQIDRMYASLNPGGRLVVVVPCFQMLYGKRDVNNGHYRRYHKKELIEKLTTGGFEIESSRYWNMLGFAPYWFSERVLRKELNTDLRTDKPKGFLKRQAAKFFHGWFRHVENRFSFGFGLSLMCIAHKPKAATQSATTKEAA